MIDPKMVERSPTTAFRICSYRSLDPKKASGAAVGGHEMMSCYKKFNENSARNFADYNAEAERREREYDYETEDEDARARPALRSLLVVIVVDELADLMLPRPPRWRNRRTRDARRGHALIIATQRPSADVITGLMKANIPSRISFVVASALESRYSTRWAPKTAGQG